MLDPLRRVVSHEELFVERYDALLRTALRVTEGDRQAAEDLVQDAYIRFTLVQPPLDEVERLDAYFYVMLRNMHTSRVRRRGRAPAVSLSILDFDTLDIGLDALDAAGRLEIHQTLYAACEYGCLRRHTSKAGSLFLLRFFHGYLPSEIAKMAGLSRAMVDDRLYRARREAAAFVHDPDRVAFITDDRAMRARLRAAREDAEGSDDVVVRRLRAMMFSERHDTCWSARALRERYQTTDRMEPLMREELAALVCCPVCLEAVNTILGIGNLASRWPTDTLGPDTRGESGSGTGARAGRASSASSSSAGAASSSSAKLAAARQRVRTVFEHRPRELRVLVNGFELGSHTLGSPRSALVLTAAVGEPVALVEVFSEQGLCLLFLDACPPPDGPVRQRRRVELSDGRYADLEVAFDGPWPTITATYVDPRGAAAGAATMIAAMEQDAEDESLRAADVRAADVPAAASKRTPWSRVFGWDFGFGLGLKLTFRPAPTLVMLGLLLVWLLFWTPGVQVSAAERIADTIKWVVTQLIGSSKVSDATRPAVSPAIASSSASPAFAPAPPRGAAATASGSTPSRLRLTGAKRANLELKALASLQRVDAYLGQEVSFGADDDTRVDLRATVDGEARKAALQRSLAALVRGRDVRADITDLRTVAGGLQPSAVQGEPARDVVFVRDEFPMFEPLRQYFTRQRDVERQSGEAGPVADATQADDAQVDGQVRRFAMRQLEHSRRALQHAWALKHLAERFPASTIAASSAETRDLWQTVVREHARSYRQEIAQLRADLAPVIVESASAAPIDAKRPASSLPLPLQLPIPLPLPGEGEADTWSRIVRLLELQKAHDEAIRAAFSIRRDRSATSLLQTRAFWRLLDASDALATEIADSH